VSVSCSMARNGNVAIKTPPAKHASRSRRAAGTDGMCSITSHENINVDAFCCEGQSLYVLVPGAGELLELRSGGKVFASDKILEARLSRFASARQGPPAHRFAAVLGNRRPPGFSERLDTGC